MYLSLDYETLACLTPWVLNMSLEKSLPLKRFNSKGGDIFCSFCSDQTFTILLLYIHSLDVLARFRTSSINLCWSTWFVYRRNEGKFLCKVCQCKLAAKKRIFYPDTVFQCDEKVTCIICKVFYYPSGNFKFQDFVAFEIGTQNFSLKCKQKESKWYPW